MKKTITSLPLHVLCWNNLYTVSCCWKYYSKVLKRFSFCFEIEKSSKIAVFKLLCFESVVTQYQNILKKITIFESPLRLYHVFNSRSRKLRDIHQFSNMTLQGLSIVLYFLNMLFLVIRKSYTPKRNIVILLKVHLTPKTFFSLKQKTYFVE